MNSLERRATFGLASIFMLRMLGLFLVLPVFSIYAEHLGHSTPLLIGLALGVYGLTQAILQIPFGAASDRFGRKPIILMGLIIFIVGSIIAANATTIYGVIAGRALQGGGAIAAAVIALLADLTREEQRSKAMALIGISIGGSFIISLLLGPVLDSWIGVPGIFWLTAVLAVAGIFVLFSWVPTPVRRVKINSERSLISQISEVLRTPELLRLDFGIFALHCVLTAVFVAVPLALEHQVKLVSKHQWEIYLPVMLLSIVFMVPFLLMSERKGKLKPIFVGSISVLVLSQTVLFAGYRHFWGIFAGLVAFFAAFNLLEATLPSLVSRTAPVDSKGMAIGVYNSFEFFGAFTGGTLGGWLYGHFSQPGVFAFAAGVLLLWVLIASGMKGPVKRTTHTFHFPPAAKTQIDALAARLEAIDGVSEVVMVAEEGVAYVRTDGKEVSRDHLEAIIAAEATAT